MTWRRGWGRGACVAALATAASACSVVLGIDDGVLDTGDDAGTIADATRPPLDDAGDARTAPPDGAQPVPDSGQDAATPIDAGRDAQAPPPIDAGADAPPADALPPPPDAAPTCQSRVVDDANFFVVPPPSGVDSPTCGGRSDPCATIQQALDNAKLVAPKTIYVDQGTYAESITLHAGLTLQGGWAVVGQTWSPICAGDPSAAVTIAGVADVAVMADALGGTATLDTLTVRTKTTASSGESLYGVFARGATTTLVLTDVEVIAADGGVGTHGANGAQGANGTGYCTAGDGGAGPEVANGAGADAGSFTANGWLYANGSAGANGNPGSNGTASTGATCVGCEDCRSATQTCSLNSCTIQAGAQSCGTSGSSGCGGKPGTAGGPGTGGGSSVALFVWDATVVTSGGSLTSGNGGAGGHGGDGADGGAGSLGKGGAAGALCFRTITSCTCQSPSCAAAGSQWQGAAGSTGGTGGAASGGSGGGGGSGGSSYALYVGGAGTANVAGDTALANGSAGPGGVPGGAPGQAARRFP